MPSIERPAEGEIVKKDMGIKGEVLVSDEIGAVSFKACLLAEDGTVLDEWTLQAKELKESAFNKAYRKVEDQIVAGKGYKLKDSHSTEELEEGDYTIRICAVEEATGKEDELYTAMIKVSHEKVELETEAGTKKAEWSHKEEDFAIGLDEIPAGTRISPEQFVITGWVNAPEGAEFEAVLDVDKDFYTKDKITDQGGSVAIERVPRSLEDISEDLRGTWNGDPERAGLIITYQLPFLEEGEHELVLALYPNLIMGQYIDLGPMDVVFDSSVKAESDAVSRIAASWKAELPEEETESETSEEQERGEAQH